MGQVGVNSRKGDGRKQPKSSIDWSGEGIVEVRVQTGGAIRCLCFGSVGNGVHRVDLSSIVILAGAYIRERGNLRWAAL